MKPSRFRAPLVAAALLLVAIAGGILLMRAGRHGRAVPQSAVDRATQSLIAQQDTLDPILAIILDSVRRRFDLAVPSQTPYVDAAQQAARNAGTVMRTGDRQADMLAIFRRLMDPSATATLDDIDALHMPIDQVTATALHCQTVRLPADFLLTLDEMVQIGGYAMTHAIIASQWLVESGCVPATTIAERRQRYVDALVRQIEKDEGHITDRRVEALATLFYMGGGEHARQDWVDFVVKRQLPDGQWSGYADQPEKPNAHTTLMALWMLLEARSEGQPSLAPMVVQRASPTTSAPAAH